MNIKRLMNGKQNKTKQNLQCKRTKDTSLTGVPASQINKERNKNKTVIKTKRNMSK